MPIEGDPLEVIAPRDPRSQSREEEGEKKKLKKETLPRRGRSKSGKD